MSVRKPGLIFSIVVLGCCCLCRAVVAAAQEADETLRRARGLFQQEHFEEALPLFIELDTANPQSAAIAFELGLTYKRLQDYNSAQRHFTDALTRQPIAKAAFSELIDVFLQKNDPDAAQEWVGRAEQEGMNSAAISFQKALILIKMGKDYEGALAALDAAVRLDPALSKAVEYQRGIVRMHLKDFDAAQAAFDEVITRAANTELAEFANEYIAALESAREADKKLRGSLGYAVQHDDNVVFRPQNDALAQSVSEDDDWRHVFTAAGDYTRQLSDALSVKAGGSFYGTKQDQLGFYDMMSYDLPLQATLRLKNATVAFPVHYNYVTVNDRRYLEVWGMGTTANLPLDQKNMLQLQAQHSIKKYRFSPSVHDDQKSGREYLAAIGVYHFFGRRNAGFLNLRYALNYEDTVGRNWTYTGNRFTMTAVIPFLRRFKWNAVGDIFLQDFSKQNSTYDKDRSDYVCTASNLLAWEFMRNAELQVQHTFVYDGSSIGIYKYRKNIYGVGVKYRF